MLCGWGVKADFQVKLCDPCLNALEVVTTMRYTNRRILYLLYFTPHAASIAVARTGYKALP